MKLALLTGCGHTGTTILARMLGAHSKVFNPPFETNIFLAYNVLKWRVLLDAEVLKAKKEKPGCELLLEKTPRHVWHVDYVRRVLPETRFVLMTRNGRDVIASLYARTQDLQGSIRRYKDDSLLTIRQLDGPNTMLVRYEDFIDTPEKELAGILAFLGLKWEPEVLSYHEKPVAWFGVQGFEKGSGSEGAEHDKLRNWQVNQPLFRPSSSWTEKIPESLWGEVDEFFASTGDCIMKELGYVKQSGPGEKPPFDPTASVTI